MRAAILTCCTILIILQSSLGQDFCGDGDCTEQENCTLCPLDCVCSAPTAEPKLKNNEKMKWEIFLIIPAAVLVAMVFLLLIIAYHHKKRGSAPKSEKSKKPENFANLENSEMNVPFSLTSSFSSPTPPPSAAVVVLSTVSLRSSSDILPSLPRSSTSLSSVSSTSNSSKSNSVNWGTPAKFPPHSPSPLSSHSATQKAPSIPRL
eukprot:Phypoly_transcript_14833.p1 GENE.Phypoly_transcript_14833~~Phypoly_transcript_14833.p1  ORF type:complete len:205 (+),score=50.73 Phypoly_transcript_14833:200-814(+)